MEAPAFLNVGGGWEKKDRNGDRFISIRLNVPVDETLPLLVFSNKFKLNGADGRPDFVVMQPAPAPIEQEEYPF